jgi:Ran GTPase-activating protein (RanGAP) involved in mRNA processing and transport
LDAAACAAVTAAGALAALRRGGCAGLQRLVLRTTGTSRNVTHVTGPDLLSAKEAQLLAAACPALAHAACRVRCSRPADVAAACALLPGPLTLLVDLHVNVARAALQLPARVTALVLRQCLDAHAVVALGDALRTNATLKSLDLDRSRVGNAGAAALGVALRVNATLTSLAVAKNDIDDEGAAALAEALRVNATLTTLNLQDNRIGDAGAVALGGALRVNATLTSLVLDFNRIGDAGAVALAEALRVNAALTTLDLDYNGVGDVGADALGEALRVNATLTTLTMNNAHVTKDGLRAMCHAVRANTTLITVSLRGINVAGGTIFRFDGTPWFAEG